MEEHLRQLMHLAREHYQNHEYDKAEPLLLQIVRDHRGFADMFNMLGVILHGHGRFSQAQEMFEEALRINPSYTEAALNLAVTYNDTGKYKEAQETYRHALSRSGARAGKVDRFVQGKLANMYAEIGDVWLSSGLYQEAIQEYRRALELGPAFADIRCKLAGALRDDHPEDFRAAKAKLYIDFIDRKMPKG